MADYSFSRLPPATEPLTGSEIFAVSQLLDPNVAGFYESRRTYLSNFRNWVVSNFAQASNLNPVTTTARVPLVDDNGHAASLSINDLLALGTLVASDARYRRLGVGISAHDILDESDRYLLTPTLQQTIVAAASSAAQVNLRQGVSSNYDTLAKIAAVLNFTTTTSPGLWRFATIVEAQAGTAGNLIVSPQSLSAVIASAVAALVASAPTTLNTLKELADALGDDPNYASTVSGQIGLKANSTDVYTRTQTYMRSEVYSATQTDALLLGKSDTSHVHAPFTPATSTGSGVAGFVPAPNSGQRFAALTGSGYQIPYRSPAVPTAVATDFFVYAGGPLSYVLAPTVDNQRVVIKDATSHALSTNYFFFNSSGTRTVQIWAEDEWLGDLQPYATCTATLLRNSDVAGAWAIDGAARTSKLVSVVPGTYGGNFNASDNVYPLGDGTYLTWSYNIAGNYASPQLCVLDPRGASPTFGSQAAFPTTVDEFIGVAAFVFAGPPTVTYLALVWRTNANFYWAPITVTSGSITFGQYSTVSQASGTLGFNAATPQNAVSRTFADNPAVVIRAHVAASTNSMTWSAFVYTGPGVGNGVVSYAQNAPASAGFTTTTPYAIYKTGASTYAYTNGSTATGYAAFSGGAWAAGNNGSTAFKNACFFRSGATYMSSDDNATSTVISRLAVVSATGAFSAAYSATLPQGYFWVVPLVAGSGQFIAATPGSQAAGFYLVTDTGSAMSQAAGKGQPVFWTGSSVVSVLADSAYGYVLYHYAVQGVALVLVRTWRARGPAPAGVPQPNAHRLLYGFGEIIDAGTWAEGVVPQFSAVADYEPNASANLPALPSWWRYETGLRTLPGSLLMVCATDGTQHFIRRQALRLLN